MSEYWTKALVLSMEVSEPELEPNIVAAAGSLADKEPDWELGSDKVAQNCWEDSLVRLAADIVVPVADIVVADKERLALDTVVVVGKEPVVAVAGKVAVLVADSDNFVAEELAESLCWEPIREASELNCLLVGKP